MATTISLPTAVSTNSISGNNLFADDGTNTTGAWTSLHANVDLSSFSSLSIPAGATIDGIEVVVDGQGNTGPGTPRVQVYNGTSWSSAVTFSGSWSKTNAEFDPGWGSSSNLWGLSWNATTAAAITVRVISSSLSPGRRIYWDWVRVRITYTEAAYGNKVNDIQPADISKINGLETANIEKVIGV